MSQVQHFIDNTLRGEINRLLATFPENQTSLFARAFPGGIERSGETVLRDALALCYRTVASNAAGRAALSQPARSPKGEC